MIRIEAVPGRTREAGNVVDLAARRLSGRDLARFLLGFAVVNLLACLLAKDPISVAESLA